MQYHELTNSIMILRVGLGESRFDGGGAGYCCYGIKPITLGSNVHRTQHTGLQCKHQSKRE